MQGRRDRPTEARLDPRNGIPLIATLDALFDRGLISFDTTGKMLVSDRLSDDERRVLGVLVVRPIEVKSAKMVEYLKWHRQQSGFDG